MRRALVILWLACAASCIDDDLLECGNELCPVNGICVAGQCVTKSQIEACNDIAQGEVCDFDGLKGICLSGACFAAYCGNGLQEGLEVCDDGNEQGGDGCSARCDSLERCGNGVIDYVVGEQCDDNGIGAGFTGDGCSSGCELEYDLWREVTPRAIAARGGYAMAYDEQRHEAVLFGGGTAQDSGGLVSQLRGETWAFDGVVWSRREPLSSPSARYGAVMTYMSARNVMVMFGGFDANSTALAETWVWNGVTWTNLPLSVSPPARGDHAMAYDAARDRIVLFAGRSSSIDLADTWEFDGTAWTQVNGGTPPARSRHVFIYDPARGKIVLWGGLAAGQPLTDTWEFSGGTWSHIITSTVPNGPVGPAGAFDPRAGVNAVTVSGGKPTLGSAPTGDHFGLIGGNWVNLGNAPSRTRHVVVWAGDRLVQFGGFQLTAVYSTTYQHEGSIWSAVTLGFDPGVRRETPGAYDSWRHRWVTFGGTAGTVARTETWEWDGLAWRERVPTTTVPLSRYAHATAYDEKRRETVIFGGIAGANVRGDTWTWDGDDWYDEMQTTAPSPRWHTAMVYDAAREQVVLFGGEDMSGTLGDTWLWNGSIWAPVTPPMSPSARANPSLVYDRLRSTVLLYGGDTAAGELWEWNGATWTELPMTAGAPTVVGAGIAFDPVRDVVVLVGGVDLSTGLPSNAVWEWNRVIWRLRAPPVAPPGRFGAAVVYDPVVHRVLLYGGEDELGARGDTWTYGFQAATPPDACVDVDTDDDGLVGCDDPDCWARCTPTCPPGTSCSSTPLCGDGVCQPLEDIPLCNADC